MEANQWIYKVSQSQVEEVDPIYITQIDLDNLDIKEIQNGEYHILSNNKSLVVKSILIDLKSKQIEFTLNETKRVYSIQDSLDILVEKMGLDIVRESLQNEIVAPMPGTVLSVEVKENQDVTKGQTLVILEAMKMENTIKASADSKIKTIHVKKGEAVDKDQILVST